MFNTNRIKKMPIYKQNDITSLHSVSQTAVNSSSFLSDLKRHPANNNEK